MASPRSILDVLNKPEKNFLLYFLFGVVLITLIADGISDLVWNYFIEYLYEGLNKSISKWIIKLGLILVLLIILYILIKSPLYQWLAGMFNQLIESKITQVKLLQGNFRGLIVAMGVPQPNRPTAAETCIRHHWGDGKGIHLEHCWLICTDRTLNHAVDLAKKLQQEGINVKFYFDSNYPTKSKENLSLHIPKDKEDNPLYAQSLMDCIYADAQKNKGLEELDIIADLTGGLSSITVGIALACTPASRRLQYISQIDNDFKEIEFAYQLKEDKS